MKTRKIYKFVQTHLCSMHSIDHGTDTNITIQYALYIDVPIFVSIYSIHLQYIHLSTVLFIYLIWLCIFIKYIIYIYTQLMYIVQLLAQHWILTGLVPSFVGRFQGRCPVENEGIHRPWGIFGKHHWSNWRKPIFVWKLASSEIWFKPFERN